jgi:hypothetical protein
MIPKPLTKPVAVPVPQKEDDAVKDLARMILRDLSTLQLKMFTFENNIIPEDRMKKIIRLANRTAKEYADPAGEIAKRLREESNPNPKPVANNAIEIY